MIPLAKWAPHLISVYCCGFIHPLSNQYVSNRSILLESRRWIYGPVLCVTRAGCRMRTTLVITYALCAKRCCPFPLVSVAISILERNLLDSTAKWRISPQETVRQIVSVSPLINLGYFIVPCNLISQHGYLCLKCLKLKCDGTEGIQNPGVALPREHISLSVYAYVCFSVKLCSCVRQKRGQMFLVWLHPLWLLSECWHD